MKAEQIDTLVEFIRDEAKPADRCKVETFCRKGHTLARVDVMVGSRCGHVYLDLTMLRQMISQGATEWAIRQEVRSLIESVESEAANDGAH